MDVLGGESVPSTIVDAFASVPVVLLGYREIPDQTSSEQARATYGTQAEAELDELRTVFEAAGCDVSTRLAFTHDRLKTFERAAIEDGCDAVFLPNPAPVLERVLVAIRGDVNVEHIAQLVAMVLADTELSVTLFHVTPSADERARGEACLETAASILEDRGVDPARIDISVVVDDSVTDAILDAAADHDLLVAGESRPSIRRAVLRDRARRLAKRTVDPVLVVRGAYLAREEGDAEAMADDPAVQEEAPVEDERVP